MQFGIRVDSNCMTPRTDLTAWNVDYISIVVRRKFIDRQREYMQKCRQDNIKIAAVYDKDSLFGDFDDYWIGDAWGTYTDQESLIERFKWYALELGDYIWLHIIGNEPDGEGESSWVMRPAQFLAMGQCAKLALPFRILVSGGLCSGDPHFLEGLYGEYEKVFDYGNIHPYGQRPEIDWPNSSWGFGYFGDLLAHYQDHLPNTSFVCGEWGTESAKIGEKLQADYALKMAEKQRDLGVSYSFYFCAGDYMVPTWGARYADWTRKQPLYDTLRTIGLNNPNGEDNMSRYSHPKGQHEVGPGVKELAEKDGATILSCELYYPLDRANVDETEYSETMAELNGKGVIYRYSFDTGKVYRFRGY